MFKTRATAPRLFGRGASLCVYLLGYLFGYLILLFRFRHFQMLHPVHGRIETVVSIFQIRNMEVTQRAQGFRHGTHGCFPPLVLLKFPGTNGQKKTGGAWQTQAIRRRFSICSSLYDSTGGTGLSRVKTKVYPGFSTKIRVNYTAIRLPRSSP